MENNRIGFYWKALRLRNVRSTYFDEISHGFALDYKFFCFYFDHALSGYVAKTLCPSFDPSFCEGTANKVHDLGKLFSQNVQTRRLQGSIGTLTSHILLEFAYHKSSI